MALINAKLKHFENLLIKKRYFYHATILACQKIGCFPGGGMPVQGMSIVCRPDSCSNYIVFKCLLSN